MNLLSKIISLGIILSGISPQLKLLLFNKEPNIDAEEPSEQALLREYEACQHDSSSTSVSFWTLASIFIGISSALLAGLLYGLIANNNLFPVLLKVLFGESAQSSELRLILTLSLIVIILSISIFIILYKLWGWLRRARFLQQTNFKRMREIELELGMWKSWRIHTIDEWQRIKDDKPFEKKLDKLVNILKENLNIKYSDLLSKRERALAEVVKSVRQSEYEIPTSRGHFKWILGTLFVLWGLFLILALAAATMAIIGLIKTC